MPPGPVQTMVEPGTARGGTGAGLGADGKWWLAVFGPFPRACVPPSGDVSSFPGAPFALREARGRVLEE